MAVFQSARGPLHFENLGTGQAILLVHGFTNYGLFWTPQLAALVHSGYRAIVPDLHGHGASKPADALCTVPSLAHDMTALLDHLAIGQAVVCGLSLGGMVALQMAVDRPDRVAGLIVANTRSSFSDPEMVAMADGWIAVFEQEQGPLKRLAATWPRLGNAAFRESAAGRAGYDVWARILARLPGASLSQVARGMTRFDLRGRLAAIAVPTLVIAGEQDLLFRADEAREIASEIPSARLAVIAGAGHLSNMDSPDQFNCLMLEFLATHFHAG